MIPTQADQLVTQGIRVFPCWQNKKPAVSSWQEPVDIRTVNWPSEMVGVPIPDGVVVIDLDTYKGISRQDVEQAIGCSLPWDQALVQSTPKGGQHYAFRVTWAVKQGSDLSNLKGLDTRVSGKGYICTSSAYQPGIIGLSAFAFPQALPSLPDNCRSFFEAIKKPAQTTPTQDGVLSVADIRDALRHLDPGAPRSDWVNHGVELRSGFGDDEETGFSLFDEWSRGELWKNGCPENYVAEHMRHQWESFKAEGARHINSLFYQAIAAGWKPPASVDTALAFGVGADNFQRIIQRIQESGTDASQTIQIAEEIKLSGCNRIQNELLLNELLSALKSAKIYSKTLGDGLRKSITDHGYTLENPPLTDILELKDLPLRALSRPCNNHGTNSENIVREIFGNRIEIVDDEIRFWSGSCWQHINEETMGCIVSAALRPDKHSTPNINGTRTVMRYNVPKPPPRERDKFIYFRNCIFDTVTGQTYGHQRNNYNIGTLSVDFDPNAQAPHWFHFLKSIFGGLEEEQQRYSMLQETMGWALMRHSLGIQKVVVYDGANRGGKSLILGCLQSIVGPDASGTALFCNLGDGKTQGAFRSKDIVFDLEATKPTGITTSLATGFLKAMSANDRISIQLLNIQEPWEGKLNCKYMISCNEIPTLIDDSGATSERFIVLNFIRSFADKQDLELTSKLHTELPGIAMWALEGARRLVAQSGAFTLPQSSIDAISQMREGNQPLLEYIDEHLILDPNAMTHYKDMYVRYREFCTENGLKIGTKTAFCKSLRKTLGEKATHRKAFRVSGGPPTSGLQGVRLASPFSQGNSLQVVK